MDNLRLLDRESIKQYIRDVKNRLGDQLVIPVHHYVPQDVVELSDILGDSYKLAVDVSRSKARWIVFCGVTFMAEGAAILANDNQTVLSPDFSAGCPMADMIDRDRAEKAFQMIVDQQGREPVPVVYMNSYADSKAFTGAHGGAVCTSSNAEKIIKFYLDQNKSIFFFPDQHLGRNVSLDMGLKPSEIALINKDFKLILEPNSTVDDIKVFLWDGNCPLHQRFSLSDIDKFRLEFPKGTVMVHPEVPHEICAKSDLFGSTQIIYNTVRDAPVGSQWCIGTELNFTHRMALEFKDKTIIPLKPVYCKTMSRITLEKLAETLQALETHLLDGTPLSHVMSVDASVKEESANALNQMIQIVEG